MAVTQIHNPGINSLIGSAAGGGPEKIFATLLARFFSASLAIGSIMLLIYIVINAFKWLSSDDPGAISGARQGIFNAIIGLTIMASVFAIANFIAPLLGLSTPTCNFPQNICWPTF